MRRLLLQSAAFVRAARRLVKKHPEAMQRFKVDWTPTVLIVDGEGQELHRIEGFLPTDEFLGQLQLGFGHAQFTKGNFADAERHFRDVCEQLSGTDAAAEATYWAGVSRYKGSNDASALASSSRTAGKLARLVNATACSAWPRPTNSAK